MIKVETQVKLRNSVKYLYLIAGCAKDAMRTSYKHTTDVLSTEQTWNKLSVVLYNVVECTFVFAEIWNEHGGYVIEVVWTQ